MMDCRVPGGLRTSVRTGGATKKRVHFSDECLPLTHSAGSVHEAADARAEDAQIGAPAEAKSCCYAATGLGSVEVEFAKASITCGVNAHETATEESLSEGNPGDKIWSFEGVQVTVGACNGSEFTNLESPCTPPSGGGHCSSAVFKNRNSYQSNPHIHKAQKKLTFVVGTGDQMCRRYSGLTTKKPDSRLSSYKISPQSEATYSKALPNPPLRHGAHVFGASEGVCKKRCAWITPNSDAAYVAYHDEEWGVPVHEDRRLFELLVFAGAQAEMAWSSLLTKRDAYRDAFAQFDPVVLATCDATVMAATLKPQRDTMKSEARVQSIVANAKVVMKIVEEFGSFSDYLWRFVSYKPIVGKFKQAKSIPTRTAKSEAISKDMQRRGMRHAGPMVVYSFMQAAGLANDHLLSCFRHPSATLSSSPSPPLPSLPSTKPLISPLCC